MNRPFLSVPPARLRLVLSVCAVAILAGLGFGLSGCQSAPPGPGAARFPNVELVTHAGKMVRFYDDLLKGKVVVLNFMYTTCQGGCVPSTENLMRVFEQLGDRVGKDVFFYSISLDPTNDTPAALREYMELHEVGPGWVFLTGEKDNLERVRRSVGFVDIDPVVDARKTEHAGLVLVGSEKLDRWIKCPALGRPADLLESISWMDPDYIEAHGETTKETKL